MITEDYVSFEIAKLLKEKGFDERVKSYYTESGLEGYMLALKATKNTELGDGFISRPTLQMTMKWLREVHKIDITVDPHEVGNNWIYEFHICQNKDYLFSRDVDTSYENCAKAAIKYCLENLI